MCGNHDPKLKRKQLKNGVMPSLWPNCPDHLKFKKSVRQNAQHKNREGKKRNNLINYAEKKRSNWILFRIYAKWRKR